MLWSRIRSGSGWGNRRHTCSYLVQVRVLELGNLVLVSFPLFHPTDCFYVSCKGTSPNYFGKSNVIVTFRGGGLLCLTFCDRQTPLLGTLL